MELSAGVVFGKQLISWKDDDDRRYKARSNHSRIRLVLIICVEQSNEFIHLILQSIWLAVKG